MSQALWHIDSTQSELRPASAPPDGSLQAISSLYSLISTGTERLVATASVDPECQELMAVPHMEGDFTLPIKYGYSLVGTIDDGRLVHCMHPHQSVAYEREDRLFVLPDSASARTMTLLSNMETVLTAIWDADLDEASEAAVCGFGNIGALLANTLRLYLGLSPAVIESDAWRRNKAEELGFHVLAPDTEGHTFPILFQTTGNEQALQWCIEHASRDGTVVELSWYGNRPVTLSLGRHFHYNRIRIISSQVSSIPPRVRARISRAERKRIAADLLVDDSFDALVTDEIPFSESPAFFDELRDGKQGNGLIWVLRY